MLSVHSLVFAPVWTFLIKAEQRAVTMCNCMCCTFQQRRPIAHVTARHMIFSKHVLNIAWTAEGRLLAECEETGLGYRWEGAALGTLQDYQPKNGHRCA